MQLQKWRKLTKLVNYSTSLQLADLYAFSHNIPITLFTHSLLHLKVTYFSRVDANSNKNK